MFSKSLRSQLRKFVLNLTKRCVVPRHELLPTAETACGLWRRRQQNDMLFWRRESQRKNSRVEGLKNSNTLANFSANDRLFALLLADC